MANRSIGEHQLTSEMNAIVDSVLAGDSVKGFAFAGSGKSTLLRAVEKYHKDKRGLYLCYNKSLEMEARKLFNGHSVDIATSHSLALNSFTSEESERFIAKTQAKMNKFEFQRYTSSIEPDTPLRQALDVDTHWKAVFAVCEQFICTASIELSSQHITPKVKAFVKKRISEGHLQKSESDAALSFIENLAKQLIQEMLDTDSNCPMTHDAYIKVWQLNNPTLDYDYIMFDEAQDANPVLLSLILKQKAQLIFVGDKYQSIYQFRGGVNAMDIIPLPSYPLSRSFRYGNEIASLATKILGKMDLRVKVTGLGESTEILEGTPNHDLDPVMCITYRNDSLLSLLIDYFQQNQPAILCNGKTQWLRDTLQSLLHFKAGEPHLSQFPKHKKYKTYDELIALERDGNTSSLVHYIEETDESRVLLDALNWSLEQVKPIRLLTTAHMCKGLESDTVYLHHDFQPIMKAYGQGKPIDDTDLNLLYVAITRTKKRLYLASPLKKALDTDLAFSVRPYKPEPCLLDNLIPKEMTARFTVDIISHTQPLPLNTMCNSESVIVFDESSEYEDQCDLEDEISIVTVSQQKALSEWLTSEPNAKTKAQLIADSLKHYYKLSDKQEARLNTMLLKAFRESPNLTATSIQGMIEAHSGNFDALTVVLEELETFQFLCGDNTQHLQHKRIELQSLPPQLRATTQELLTHSHLSKVSDKTQLKSNKLFEERLVIVSNSTASSRIFTMIEEALLRDKTLAVRYISTHCKSTPESLTALCSKELQQLINTTRQ
ncbi:UvrD-helicase domain-containing protein [Vibrio sp. 10N.261.46.A3]|uniref:UvrD-helicase domain-containing protein n=1 Tax=Vibrio sp. 10N.261.46.A3 TaxID=3229658 RepID=UPI0035531FC6